MQVDPIQPKLKPPGIRRLRLKYDNCFQFCLKFAFKFKLRRYTKDKTSTHLAEQRVESYEEAFQKIQQATGRGLHSPTFRLNLSAFCRIGVHPGIV